MNTQPSNKVHGYDIVPFETNLKIGDEVIVYWTNSNRCFSGRAKVSKINEKSIISVLTENVATDFFGGYKIGQKIKVPKFVFGSGLKIWSPNNRVAPVSVH